MSNEITVEGSPLLVQSVESLPRGGLFYRMNGSALYMRTSGANTLHTIRSVHIGSGQVYEIERAREVRPLPAGQTVKLTPHERTV